jgi:ribulose-phosphate 3-epimerase
VQLWPHVHGTDAMFFALLRRRRTPSRPRVAPVQISPSILSADFANLERELGAIANADWAHVDVMDNHFVPNLTLGLPIVEALVRVTPIPIDCHLMIEDPDRWAPGYAEAGARLGDLPHRGRADAVATGSRDPRPLVPGPRSRSSRDSLRALRGPAARGRHGARHDRRARLRRPVLHGRPDAQGRQVREAVRRHGGEVWIQVDGGVSAATIEQCADAGADVFVAGSAVYGAESASAAIEQLRALATAHTHR